MLEFYLRKSYQRCLVDKPAKIFAKIFSPNFITLLALIFGVLNPIFLYNGFSYLAIFCLLASGYCDTLDGTIARLQKSGSEIGSVFDIVVDRIVEFAAVFGLFLFDPTHRGLACMCMLGSILICVTSFLVVGIFSENIGKKSFFYSAGLMERAEAFAFFIAMILLPKYFNLLAALFTILVLWTTIIRVYTFSSNRTKFFIRSENNVDV